MVIITDNTFILKEDKHMKSKVCNLAWVPEGWDVDTILLYGETEKKKKEELLPVVVPAAKEKDKPSKKKENKKKKSEIEVTAARDVSATSDDVDLASMMKSMMDVLTNPVEPVTFVSDKVKSQTEYVQLGYIILAKEILDANPSLNNKILKISTELYKFEQVNGITDKEHLYFVEAFENENEFRIREVSSHDWRFIDIIVAWVHDGLLEMSATLPKAV